jgi:predicted nucleic acid-binding Zn ribbon protein
MNPGAGAGRTRHCVECGKPIVHRRMTALYCSGKCREIHNAGKRRQARHEMKNAAQAARPPEDGVCAGDGEPVKDSSSPD